MSIPRAALFALLLFAAASRPAPATETAYSPPATEPGPDGARLYKDAPTHDAASAASLLPGRASPEAAVVHYLASRVRGDRAHADVLPGPSARSPRLVRGLQQHDAWAFHAFRLVDRVDLDDGRIWVKVWMRISAQGDEDDGTDEFTVRCDGDRCTVVEVPT